MVNDDDDEDANIERVRFRATRVCLSRCEEDIVRNTEEEEEKKGEKRGEEEAEEKRITNSLSLTLQKLPRTLLRFARARAKTRVAAAAAAEKRLRER